MHDCVEDKAFMTEASEIQGRLLEMYQALLARFGHRRWWPAETAFEMCVGAVLTQNTAWKNVTQAIENLKTFKVLDISSMHRLGTDELALLIKPSGYYNIKAKRLKNLVRHIVERHQGQLSAMFSLPLDVLRQELLSVNGVGKETADSIILYAAHKPIFVVDAYTKRVLGRHGMLSLASDYDDVQAFFHQHLPRDTLLFNDFHAQFVAVGKHYCKTKPVCKDCPLLEVLSLPGPPEP